MLPGAIELGIILLIAMTVVVIGFGCLEVCNTLGIIEMPKPRTIIIPLVVITILVVSVTKFMKATEASIAPACSILEQQANQCPSRKAPKP